jgi:hypothetical protein
MTLKEDYFGSTSQGTPPTSYTGIRVEYYTEENAFVLFSRPDSPPLMGELTRLWYTYSNA